MPPRTHRSEAIHGAAGSGAASQGQAGGHGKAKLGTTPPTPRNVATARGDYTLPVGPQPQNGLGTAGFILGLVGLIFSIMPIVGVVAWPMVITGLILAIVARGRVADGVATNGAMATAGLVLSIIGLAICVAWLIPFLAAGIARAAG